MNSNTDCLSMKKILRKEIKQRVSQISAFIPEYSSKICDLIIQSEVYKACRNLLLYMALPDEVNLSKLISQAICDKKNIYVPKVNLETNNMDFFQYTISETMCSGAFGIMEPSVENLKYDSGNSSIKTLIIVPGRAFASDGSRLGRGKGFYDSFLLKERQLLEDNVVFCGAGFSVQFLEALPLEAHDIKMDILVNENKLFAVK